jgi:hypothetical protein
MYTAGFGTAIVLGLVVLVLPALWFLWWRVTDSRGLE